ncbi:nitrate- and nitrite sensing domain-containing protein [Nonomuraea sp. NPDC050663]|uniref:sensor histidine kinase n=1 Tax=Nonomuraea sp. NPDC050663 TaxID=3364370 RepID=UPI0037AD216A
MASGRSIRSKITLLLVIPLVSLVALWGFAASATSGDALQLLKIDSLWGGVVSYTNPLVYSLQNERLASAVQLSDGQSDATQLSKSRLATDQARQALLGSVKSDSVQSALTPEMRRQLDAVLAAIDRLPSVRLQVDDEKLDPAKLVLEYAAVSDAVHRLYDSFAIGVDMELNRRAKGLIAADQVRELLSREQAMVVAADAKPSHFVLHQLAKIHGTRTWLYQRAMGDMDAELRKPFEKVPFGPADRAVTILLEMRGELTPVIWRASVDPAMTEYSKAIETAGGLLSARIEPAGMTILVRAALTGILGLIAVLVSIVLAIRMGRGLTRELAGLRGAAQEVAEVRLPHVVQRLKNGEQVELPPPIPSGTTTEIIDVAAAFDTVQHTAVDAAVGQAKLREGVADALRNLARRTQSLVQRQLKLLEEMQGQTDDPDSLSRLFKLDHLTTRMRRHAEGLVLLAGGSTGRRWRRGVAVEEVLAGAAAQVEDYTRVRVYPMPEAGVVGTAVADLMHLFAELVENATSFSAPTNEVSVRGEVVGKGFAVEIEDRGFGMTAEDRDAVNRRLAAQPVFDPASTERLGFAVVGMLAARHGIQVTLKPSPYGGTTAIVLLPSELMESAQQDPAPLTEPVAVAAGLPRRTRKTAMPLAAPTPEPPPVELPRRLRQGERSPEQARATFSALQSGWERGRQEETDE